MAAYLDPDGVAIAAGLAARYGERSYPKRFGPTEYWAAVQGRTCQPLSAAERKGLLDTTGPMELTGLAVAEGGVSAHQERLLEVLYRDLVTP